MKINHEYNKTSFTTTSIFSLYNPVLERRFVNHEHNRTNDIRKYTRSPNALFDMSSNHRHPRHNKPYPPV